MRRERFFELIKGVLLLTLPFIMVACGEASGGVEDKISPVITLKGSVIVEIKEDEVYRDAGATANDNIDGDITDKILTINPVNSSKVGTYIITYNVKDMANNQAMEVKRTVNVVAKAEEPDRIKPIITLNGSSVVEVKQDTVYHDAGARANDNRDGDISSKIITINPVNSSKVGTYTIRYTVKDRANNQAVEVRRTVKVIAVADTIAPVIGLNGLFIQEVIEGTTYRDAGATARDNRDGDLSSKIVTINPVDSSKLGTYIITYNVKDGANNQAKEVIRTVKVVADKNIDLLLEDAEDGKTERWVNDKSHSGKSTISTLYDEERSSWVIKFSSGGDYDSYHLIFPEQNSNLTKIKWDMKWFNPLYELQVVINTSEGRRVLSYCAKDSGDYEKDVKSIYALGSNADNEQWHTIIRDMERDLHRYEPENQFKSIQSFIVYGSGLIDNVELYKRDRALDDVMDPIVIASPGIVLTFDDSIIDDWYAMRETFKEKGVHATFFCNGWRYLSEESISKFRALESDGHEIAVHTKDHLSTYDGKYNSEENKAQAYLEDQVLPEIEEMNEDSFEPKSFSYPYISGQPKHSELIRNYLPHIREFFTVVKQVDNRNESTYTFEDIQKVLQKLKETQNIGVFLAHRILPESDPDSYQYRITTEKLIAVIDEVNRLGLKFYTLEEAHRAYLRE